MHQPSGSRERNHKLKGATDIEVAPRRRSLDRYDLANLSISTSSSHKALSRFVPIREKGSGDKITGQNKLSHSKVGLGEPNCHRLPQGYDSCKIFRKSAGRTNLETPVDDFLVPPKRRSSQELFQAPSSHHLSSVGARTSFFVQKPGPKENQNAKTNQVRYQNWQYSAREMNNKKMNYGSGEFSKNSAMDAILSQAGITGLGSIIGDTPIRTDPKVASEYESKQTCEILDPELNLSRLGYTGNEPMDWGKVSIPDKKDLYLELCRRITHKKNADCRVHIGREEFSCHLIVLQCYSDLFDGYVAIKKVEIPADKCTPASFSFIYDWMISEEQSYKFLNRENVLDIFNSAKYLKIKDLVEQCWAFVDNIEVFNEDTAFLLYVDAKVKNVEEVRELMVPRIQNFFLILVSSQDWLELDVDDVKNLLGSNYIRINCEMEVFMSAVRWLKFDWANRDKYKYDVLRCVRFGNIAPWQLVDIKRNPENPEFMEIARDPAICKLIDDGLAYVIIKYWYGNENEDFQHWNTVLGLNEPHGRNWSGLDKTYFTFREFLIYLDQYRRNQLIEKSKPKMNMDKKLGGGSAHVMTPDEPVPSMEDFMSKKKAVYFMGVDLPIWEPPSDPAGVEIVDFESAEEAEKSMNALQLFTPSKNRLALRKLARLSASMVCAPKKQDITSEMSLFFQDHESILVFGGMDPYFRYDHKSSTCRQIYRFLPSSNTWHLVLLLPEPRLYHCSSFLKGKVFVAGGVDPREEENRGRNFVVNTVWSLDPIQRRWFTEPSMMEHRKKFVLVVARRKMYAIGGFNQYLECLSTVECFKPRKSQWKLLAPMKFARASFAATKYRDFIWVAGGQGVIDNQATILDAVESYSLKYNQWTTITGLNMPMSFPVLVTMQDRIYLIGGAGYKFSRREISCSLGNIEMWNPFNLRWEKVAGLMIPRHGHTVAVLGTQILILGGMTTDYNRCLKDVECYCLDRDNWIQGIEPLPIPLAGHSTISIPPASLMTKTIRRS